MKNLYSVENAYKWIKMQTTELDKDIYKSYIQQQSWDVSRKYKKLSKLMVKSKQSILKMSKHYFPQEDIQVMNKHMTKHITDEETAK